MDENNMLIKLCHFASLSAEDKDFIKMNIGQILKDIKKQEIVLYKGGAFDVAPYDGVPKYLRDPSIKVTMTDEADFLTFETEYAALDKFMKEHSHELNESYPWMKHILNLPVDNHERFLDYCDELDEYVNKMLSESPGLNKIILMNLVGEIDMFKSLEYLGICNSKNHLDVIDLQDRYLIDILHILAHMFSEIGNTEKEFDSKEAANIMWILTGSGIHIVRYSQLIYNVPNNDDFEYYWGRLKTANDLGALITDVPFIESVDDAGERVAETMEFMKSHGYGDNVYKYFNNVLPIVYGKGNWRLQIPFNILASIYKSNKVTDIIRVPCNKIGEYAIICRDAEDGNPYVLYMDINKPVEDDCYIVYGVQLTEDSPWTKLLRIDVRTDAEYNFVFDPVEG